MKLGTAHQSGHDRKLGHAESPKVPGYRLLERLNSTGPLGYEVWKAEGPGGFVAALCFLRIDPSSPNQLCRIETLRRARHPNLLATFGAWRIGRSIVLATELPDRTLWDDFLEATASGAPGIPRDDLIDHLTEAARGIDFLNGNGRLDQHIPALNFPHGAITPRTILFLGGGIKVSDIDPGHRVEPRLEGSGQSPSFHESDYLPAESLGGHPSPQTDQFSLAVTYVHLRVGRLPFAGQKSVAQNALSSRVADLSALPEGERPSIARALHHDPERRWPSCRAFLDALRDDVHSSLSFPGQIVAADEPGPSQTLAYTIAGAAGMATLAGTLFLIAMSTRTRPTDSAARASLLPPTSHPLDSRAPSTLDPEPLSATHESEPGVLVATAPGRVMALETSSPPAEPQIIPDQSLQDWPATEPPVDVRETTDPIAVPLPAPPRIQLEAPGTLVVELGKTATLPVRVAGEGLNGPVELTIEALSSGLSATISRSSQVADSGEVSGSWTLRIAADLTASGGETLSRVVASSGTTRAEIEVRITVRPSPALSARRRAEALSSQGEPDLAIAAYSESITLDPSDPLAFHGRGMAQYNKGQFAPALADLDVALRLKPESASALNNRGLIRLASGNTAEAIVDFDAAVRINPGYALVRYNRGRAYSEAGANDQALADLDETIRLDPNFAKAFKARADVLARLGRTQRAAADYDEAIRLQPNDPAALNNRGLLFFSRGEHRRAIDDFDEAIRLNPGYATVRYNRGRVYARLGDSAQALSSFDQAIRLDPTLIPVQQDRDALLGRKTVIASSGSIPATKPEGSFTPLRRLFRQAGRGSSR